MGGVLVGFGDAPLLGILITGDFCTQKGLTLRRILSQG